MLFDGLFGDTTDDTKAGDSANAVLVTYKGLAATTQKNTTADEGSSLTEYIAQWAEQFEGAGNGGLTTPVSIRVVSNARSDHAATTTSNGKIQILFRKVKTGYGDRDQAEGKDQKKEPVKDGGVEILVETLPDDTVQVRARRCEMDDDTMVKEMSEEKILQELKKAIAVWKKEHN